MHQHGYLAFGVDAQDVGVLGVVTSLGVVLHHHEVEIQALFQRGDLHLGTEHAERARIECDPWGLRGHGVTLPKKNGVARTPYPTSRDVGRNYCGRSLPALKARKSCAVEAFGRQLIQAVYAAARAAGSGRVY